MKKEIMEQKVKNYLEKTELHLFKIDGTIKKVIPFNRGDQSYYAEIKITEDKCSVWIKRIGQLDVDNGLNNTKHWLFPPHLKTESIKNFKSMRIKVGKAKLVLEDESTDINNVDLTELFK